MYYQTKILIKKELTQEQISKIISEIRNEETVINGLIQLVMESLMKSEHEVYNEQSEDVSNGCQSRWVSHGGKVFELQVPSSREATFI